MKWQDNSFGMSTYEMSDLTPAMQRALVENADGRHAIFGIQRIHKSIRDRLLEAGLLETFKGVGSSNYRLTYLGQTLANALRELTNITWSDGSEEES